MSRSIQNIIREEISAILEGRNDPGILKAVFITGGPGSGKSYISKKLFGIQALSTLHTSFSESGLKIVNSDTVFEKLLKDANVDMRRLGQIQQTDPGEWERIMKFRDKAKTVTKNKLKIYLDGRLGLILDTTGSSDEKIRRQSNLMQSLGYDVYLIFVNTPLNIAIERNRYRGTQGERTLSDDMVKEIWEQSQKNLNKLKNIIGSANVLEIDNSVSGSLDVKYQKAIQKIIQLPIQNPIGQKWLKTLK